MIQRRCENCGLWFADLKAHLLSLLDDHVSHAIQRLVPEHEHVDLSQESLYWGNNAYTAARYIGDEAGCTLCHPIVDAVYSYSKKVQRQK